MTKIFDNQFNVYNEKEKYSFLHLNIEQDSFFELLLNYFFSEENILNYIENKKNVEFNPTKRNYVKLYHNLLKFIDSENLELNEEKFLEELNKFICTDDTPKDEMLKFRKDKYGKIGEYIFSIILSKYFGFDCILPKLSLITDPNMSVFGIDTLFYNSKDKVLLFGEAKFYNKLSDGINAIKKSLDSYDKQINDEYMLVISNIDIYKMPIIENNFKNDVEECYTIKDFIEKTDINSIGIPIFIMHGGKINVEYIYDKLDSIEKKDVLGFKPTYYLISLPIIDKEKFKISFLSFIHRKLEEYKKYE